MIGVAPHHVKRFGLRNELLPMVDGEVRVRASKDAQKVAAKGLYRTFNSVGTLGERWNLLEPDGLMLEE